MKKKCEKLFGGLEMTWLCTVIFAAAAGLYTGLINEVPFLKNTSFTDIAVSFEWWILFAVIIAVNCKKPVEAGLKCFVFFLISQPLVFFAESFFSGNSVWGYYRYWLVITFLTLPGGMLAFFAKKQNIWGALILSAATSLLACTITYYISLMRYSGQHHVLTVIFCIAVILVLTFTLQKESKRRILIGIITAAAFAVSLFLTFR